MISSWLVGGKYHRTGWKINPSCGSTLCVSPQRLPWIEIAVRVIGSAASRRTPMMMVGIKQQIERGADHEGDANVETTPATTPPLKAASIQPMQRALLAQPKIAPRLWGGVTLLNQIWNTGSSPPAQNIAPKRATNSRPKLRASACGIISRPANSAEYFPIRGGLTRSARFAQHDTRQHARYATGRRKEARPKRGAFKLTVDFLHE